MKAKGRPRGNPFAGRHLRAAYRSGLEASISLALTAMGVAFTYEALRLPFTQPAKNRTYCPDFILPNGIVVESKGLFAGADRDKHLWVKAQHPTIDIRFVFSNPAAKLYKGSPTSYADWCAKHGFVFAKKVIPDEWTTSPDNPQSLAALAALGWSIPV